MEEDKAYKCPECGQIFAKASRYVEDTSPYGTHENGTFLCEYEGCPNCGSGYDVVRRCQCCMDYKATTEFDYDLDIWICDECKEKQDYENELS